ncbi:MAG: hypothetical protein KDA93_12105 [Planctomycetaceae bacterium]|nr:hypothetical protein [Planctomycetaceae bacterium]
MSDTKLSPIAYLTPSEDSFWRWSEGMKAAEWLDGTTIAFPEEIVEILNRLRSDRLPSFELILLLVAACRNNWREGDRDVARLLKRLVSFPTPMINIWSEEVVNRLHQMNELPGPLRETTAAKAELASIVFEHFPQGLEAISSEAVVSAWNEGLAFHNDADVTIRKWSGTTLMVALRAMADGLGRVDAESLALRLRTGLDSMPAQTPLPIEEDEPEPFEPLSTVRELMEELKDDPELGGLVRLARNLMAVVSLPRAIVDHDDLPMGGVSDITNRGPLDRLLISELAYDDQTLMTRVALNEALYLRRETPPAEPPRQRVLLLDNGLRMWGVPRVYQTAVALSLAATTDAHTETFAFRAEADDVVPVELRTREGLIAHLESLQTEAHPGDALDQFAESFDAATADVVLITGNDVLADAEFRRLLHESDLNATYLAGVSRDGRFELSLHSPRGDKPLKQAVLDVDKLLEPPRRPVTPLIDPGRSIEYPAIFRVEPFPLRLSHPERPEATWHVPDHGTLVLTHDRRLILWDEPERGGRQLTDTAPKGDLLWWDLVPSSGYVRAVIGKQHTGHMFLIETEFYREMLDVKRIDLQHPHFQRVVEHGGVLFVIRQGIVDVHSLSDGSHLKSLAIPRHLTLRDGRFFQSSGSWHALSYEGLTAHLEEVPLGGIKPDQVMTVFDSIAANGPVVLTKDGRFYFTHDETVWSPEIKNTCFDHVDVGRSGQRVRLGELRSGVHRIPMPGSGQVLDLETRESHPMYAPLEPDVPRELVRPPLRPIRTRFLRVGFLNAWNIVLESRRGTKWKVDLRPLAVYHSMKDQLKLVMLTGADVDRVRHVRSLDQMRAPSEVGFRLHQAVWEDGSRVILDSRGLLHLKSSDRSIPEATLVLTEPEVAVWVSDGRMWGSPYYLGDRQPNDLKDIIKTVFTPFVERIQ